MFYFGWFKFASIQHMIKNLNNSKKYKLYGLLFYLKTASHFWPGPQEILKRSIGKRSNIQKSWRVETWKTRFLSFQLAAKLSGNGNFTALIVKASSSRKLVLSNQQYLRSYSRTEAPDSCGDLEEYYEADEKQQFSTRNCPDQSSKGKLFDRCGWRLSKFRKVWSCSKSQNNEMVCERISLIIKKWLHFLNIQIIHLSLVFFLSPKRRLTRL